ncbi:MAG: hypothetical protein AB1705_07105 [Verrucomicrobiota bacterium]
MHALVVAQSWRIALKYLSRAAVLPCLILLLGCQSTGEKTLSELHVDAVNGDPDAQYKLGDAYFHGRGIMQDYDEAEKWYRKAAQQYQAEP